MIYSEKTKKAMAICYKAHFNQTDKGGMPYVFHPYHLAEQMDTEDTICAALLHDVLEDTDLTVEELRQEGIDEPVAEALELLCRRPNLSYFQYIQSLAANPIAREVKIADLKHNMDLTRLHQPDAEDLKRVKKYREALKILEDFSERDSTIDNMHKLCF